MYRGGGAAMMIFLVGGHDFFLLGFRGGLSKFPPSGKEDIGGGHQKRNGHF